MEMMVSCSKSSLETEWKVKALSRLNSWGGMSGEYVHQECLRSWLNWGAPDPVERDRERNHE